MVGGGGGDTWFLTPLIAASRGYIRAGLGGGGGQGEILCFNTLNNRSNRLYQGWGGGGGGARRRRRCSVFNTFNSRISRVYQGRCGWGWRGVEHRRRWYFAPPLGLCDTVCRGVFSCCVSRVLRFTLPSVPLGKVRFSYTFKPLSHIVAE